MTNTSHWTTRCAACGLVRPFNHSEHHQCTEPPVRLEDALEMLATADERFGQ